MKHLLQKSKCSIFHNIFKNIFQKGLLWSKGLRGSRGGGGGLGEGVLRSGFKGTFSAFLPVLSIL